MTERPILFSAPMIRSILEGRKTQTRRVVKPQPLVDEHLSVLAHKDGVASMWLAYPSGERIPRERTKATVCPYGAPGSKLWVRAPWGEYRVAPPGIVYRADEDIPAGAPERWKPSIYMPRWASRITLEITDVRVNRLHAITVSDAIAEGYDGSVNDSIDPSIRWYSALWEQINGPGSWDANPWVWCISFLRITP